MTGRPAGHHARGPAARRGRGQAARRGRVWRAGVVTAAVAVAVVAAIFALTGLRDGPASGGPGAPHKYLGVYVAGVPQSYAGVGSFTAETGVRPGVVLYYSGWMERFQTGFAEQAARHHAVPLVQIEPTSASLTSIASGRYDTYLRSYASAVKAFGGQVILSFGHEMNGYWYSWGYRHASPAAFVAAWRHVVTVFRRQGADNVTWLWTVNIIGAHAGIPSPAPWWPGAGYVDMIGIDGYYLKPGWTFAPLFGPTIKAIRALTLDPILIAETGAAPAIGQPAKIADLFAGVRAYGLLGFVWFDAVARHELPRSGTRDWLLQGQAAYAAFRHGAQQMPRTGS